MVLILCVYVAHYVFHNFHIHQTNRSRINRDLRLLDPLAVAVEASGSAGHAVTCYCGGKGFVSLVLRIKPLRCLETSQQWRQWICESVPYLLGHTIGSVFWCFLIIMKWVWVVNGCFLLTFLEFVEDHGRKHLFSSVLGNMFIHDALMSNVQWCSAVLVVALSVHRHA